MNLKTQADENKYVDALKKLVAKQNNRPCMEWQCKESLVKRCDKEPCKWCCYYGSWHHKSRICSGWCLLVTVRFSTPCNAARDRRRCGSYHVYTGSG